MDILNSFIDFVKSLDLEFIIFIVAAFGSLMF